MCKKLLVRVERESRNSGKKPRKGKRKTKKKKARVLGVSYNVTVRLDAVHRGEMYVENQMRSRPIAHETT